MTSAKSKSNIEETILSFLSDLNNQTSSSSSTTTSTTKSTTTTTTTKNNTAVINANNGDKSDNGDNNLVSNEEVSKTSNYTKKDKSTTSPFNIIPEWRPSTTFALLHPHPRRHLSPHRTKQHCYYDILDHSFPFTFPSDLLHEIQRKHGLLNQLQPAKTAMDYHIATSIIKMEIKKEENNKARYDDSMFIPRSLRQDTDAFSKNYPCFYKLIHSIEQTAKHYCSKSRAEGETKIKLDLSMTSVQLARYKGGTGKGYRRHCDDGLICQQETSPPSVVQPTGSDARRVITAVYYLTPNDWDGDLDNGCLRLYSSFSSKEDNNDDDDNDYTDVVPYPNRLVLFRSDVVEHEVLPSLRRDRIAITVWLYGWILHDDKEEDSKEKQKGYEYGKDNNVVANQNVTQNRETTTKKASMTPLQFKDNELLPLPPPSSLESASNFKIFVAIPSYRDTETHPTILSLLHNATFPNNIHVAVVYQVDTTTPDTDSSYFDPPLPHPWIITNFKSKVIDYRYAKGPCYARYLAQSLLLHHYQHEHQDNNSNDQEQNHYLLQIDSHMRFRKHWDTYLISQLSKIPAKSVLTAYPVGYTLPSGNVPNNETRGTLLVPWKFDDDGMLRQKGRLLSLDSSGGGDSEGTTNATTANKNDKRTKNDNIKCHLFAGGFNFSSFQVINDCPYDGTLSHLFFGEEISMAVRLYTHGYDLYVPPVSVCYHLWDRGTRKTIHEQDGNDSDDKSRKKGSCEGVEGGGVSSLPKWERERKESQRVVLNQVRGVGRGLGTARTAKQWSDALAVDFETKSLLPGAENGELVSPNRFVSPFSNKSDAGIEGGKNNCKDGSDDNSGSVGSSVDGENVRELVAAFLG